MKLFEFKKWKDIWKIHFFYAWNFNIKYRRKRDKKKLFSLYIKIGFFSQFHTWSMFDIKSFLYSMDKTLLVTFWCKKKKKKKEFTHVRNVEWETCVWLLAKLFPIVFTFLSFTGKKLEEVETRKNKKPLTLEGVN